jgi:hypothetical protein
MLLMLLLDAPQVVRITALLLWRKRLLHQVARAPASPSPETLTQTLFLLSPLRDVAPGIALCAACKGLGKVTQE